MSTIKILEYFLTHIFFKMSGAKKNLIATIRIFHNSPSICHDYQYLALTAYFQGDKV